MAPSSAKPPPSAGSSPGDEGIHVVVSPTRAQIAAALHPFYDFWREVCGGAVPVPRAMIDPSRIPPAVLSKLFLIEALFDPPDFRYRLIGTEVTALFGRDSTGMHIAQVIEGEANLKRITGYLETVIGRNVLLFGQERASWSQVDFKTVAVLLIPASSGGTGTDLILGAVVGLT